MKELNVQEFSMLKEAMQNYAELYGFDLYPDEYSLGKDMYEQYSNVFLSLLEKLNIKNLY